MKKEWQAEPELRRVEQTAIATLLGDTGNPTLDPMMALHLYYISGRATDSDRVLFSDATANANSTIWQVSHNGS